jgi:ABC-type branched-subunit amino acid transport system ATPase component
MACDRVIILSHGSKLAEGPPGEIIPTLPADWFNST